MRRATTSHAASWAPARSGEPVRAEAIAIARLTPMSANADTLLPGRAPSTASGVSESASASVATSHSGEELVFEEARAANT